MLDTQAKYVYEVYKSKSVSQAAKNLFISQPALSTAIKKAEKELGAEIFNRKTSPFTLTEEGKLYIEAIEKIIAIEAETKHRILDFTEIKSGRLRIGAATHISYYIIPKICEIFHKKYPQIEISIELTTEANLFYLLEKDKVDLIFAHGDQNHEDYISERLFEERYVAVLPASLNRCDSLSSFAMDHDELVSRKYGSEKLISDMSPFHGTEFIFAPKNSNIYKKRRPLLGGNGTLSYITSNLGRQQLNYNLMRAGLGALITTDSVIATMQKDSGCTYYALSGNEARQDFSIVYPKHSQSGSFDIITEFIKTSKKLFDVENPLSILYHK